MSRPITFKDAMEIGDRGCRIVKKLLKNRFPEATVYDVSAMPEYWEMDVDIVLIRGGNDGCSMRRTLIEVKADTYDSRACFLEIVSNNITRAGGCAVMTRADWLIFVQSRAGEALYVRVDRLRQWIYEHLSEYKLRNVRKSVVPGRTARYTYCAQGIVVPWRVLETECGAGIVDISVWDEDNALPVEE